MANLAEEINNLQKAFSNLYKSLTGEYAAEEDKFNFEYGSKLAFKRMWGDPDA